MHKRNLRRKYNAGRLACRICVFSLTLVASTGQIGLAATGSSQIAPTEPQDAAANTRPLSAIDWLNGSHPPVTSLFPAPEIGTDGAPLQSIPPTILLEPPVSATALGPNVTVTPLEKQLPPLGLVSTTITGLPLDLWQHSSPERVAELIRSVRVEDLPAMQSLLMTLLLSEARPAYGDRDAVLLARLDRLLERGATDPAQALVQEAGPTQSAARFARWFEATLLTGDEDRSCNALTAAPFLQKDYRARIFCAVRRGDWPMAALMMETAYALDLFSESEISLLDRFLNPDIFEGAPPLPFPQDPDALTLRIYETVGEPLPTAPLPRAYATADLRDIAGWKAQLEAAERLTRAGAMNPNQLLGLFTAREPAASGGIWDRIDAVQTLDQALNSGNLGRISRAVAPMWRAAQQAGLELAMADLFAPRLAEIELEGEAAQIVWHLQLLSAGYETAAFPNNADGTAAPSGERMNHGNTRDKFLRALARGEPQTVRAPSPLAKAISLGFADEAELAPAQTLLLAQGRLGEAILVTMDSYAHGADGNLEALSRSIAAFRKIGLEDTARRAALQLLLLDRS